MGLLDQFSETLASNPAAQQGLLNFGLALMASQGRNLGQNIGQAGLAGLGAYNQALQAGAAKKRSDLQDQMLQMQVDAQKQAQAKQKAFQDAYAAANKPAEVPDYGAGVARPIEDQQYGQAVGALPLQKIAQPQQQPSMPSGPQLPADIQALVKAYQASGDPIAAMNAVKEWKATLPKYSAQNILGKDEKGNLVQYAVNDQGQSIALPFMPAEKLKDVNLGNRIVSMGEYTGQPKGQMAIGQSPDSMASNAVQWFNAKVNADRLANEVANQRKPQFNADAGGFILPPTATNPQGGLIPLKGFPGKPLTETQSKAATFYDRMAGASKVLNNPELAGAAKPELFPTALNLATFGMAPGLSRIAQSDARKQYEQAQDNWVTANLRMESGAVIGKDEKQAEIEKYFPQIGDTPEVIAQKAAARQAAELGMQRASGVRLATTQQAPKQPQKLAPYTEADIRNTALKNGVTVEEVKRRLGIQ